MGSLANGVLKADVKTSAKLMRYIETEDIKAASELKLLYPHTGNSYIIGITGLPGSGKSSLIDVMIDHFRRNKETVGVVAIDPSSPFTGGSILGDRVRMQKHSSDSGVFIKSLPTRGWRGGISKVTSRMITVMDAMGKDIILIETAGVGQTEVEIKNLVHTTVVVLVSGFGDYIQIVKAGILEIADIFVINKVDKNNSARELEFDLKNLFNLNNSTSKVNTSKIWNPAIYLTETTSSKGIDKLTQGILAHKDYLKETGKFDEYFKSKSNRDLKEIISDYLISLLFAKFKNDSLFKRLVKDLNSNKSDPYTIAEKMLKEFFKL